MGNKKTLLDELSSKDLQIILAEKGAKAYLNLIKKLANTPTGPSKKEIQEDQDPIGTLLSTIVKKEENQVKGIEQSTRDHIGELIADIMKNEDPIGDIIRERTLAHNIPKPNPEKNNVRNIRLLIKDLPIGKDVHGRMFHVYQNYQKLDVSLKRDILALSELLGLSYVHVLAVLSNESNLDPRAISPSGARGLPQVMPSTERGVKKFVSFGNIKNAGPEERYFALLGKNPNFMRIYEKGGYNQNVAIGISYLAYLIQRHDTNTALRIYNGGPRYPDNHENLDYPRRVRDFFTGFAQLKKHNAI